jgi:hypothetical protein
MKRTLTRLAGVGAAATAILTATAATAASVPYTDPSAQGFVGLCDRAGRAVTHGSVNATPFVWRAVGSVAAPTSYQGRGRKATLTAFQPRQGTDPTEWNGDAMTAASTYTNVAHPMARATSGDISLATFLREFPPRWDGLLQLRLYYSAPNAPTDQQTYAATDIKVSGSTWTVIRGGNAACTAGSATSAESLLPPPPPRSTHNDAAPYDSPFPKPHGSASVRSHAAPAAPSSSAAAVADTAAGDAGDSGPVSAGLVLGLTGAALALGGGVIAFTRWRRRGSPTVGRAT